jgi:hypothetical protein
MRWLVLAGSIVFAYLALIPGGLVIATLDPACAGADCDQPLAEDILLGLLYAVCFLSVAGCAASMLLYFFRTTVEGELLIRRALMVALAASGATLLAFFALTFPFAALFTAAVGAAVYGTLRYYNAPGPDEEEPHDPSSNGHGKLNGHPG